MNRQEIEKELERVGREVAEKWENQNVINRYMKEGTKVIVIKVGDSTEVFLRHCIDNEVIGSKTTVRNICIEHEVQEVITYMLKHCFFSSGFSDKLMIVGE